MNKLAIAKMVATTAVSVGVGSVVGNTIRLSTPEDAKIIKKICIGVGGLALSNMVSEQVSDYTEDKFDEAVNAYENVFGYDETEETEDKD